MNSPDTFDKHCDWLHAKMRAWEDKQKVWNKNSRWQMNYAFRKEIKKNLRLLLEEYFFFCGLKNITEAEEKSKRFMKEKQSVLI